MAATWKDVTSFSRDDTERVPRSFQAQAGKFRLVVTRHIHYPPDVWVLFIQPADIAVQLTAPDIESAKSEATGVAMGIFLNAAEAIRP